MLRALAIFGVAGALFYWWTQQQASAALTTGAPSTVPDPLPQSDPSMPNAISQQQAIIVALVQENAGAEDPALILGIIEHESSFNPSAYNGSDPNGGSYGLMMLQYPTAQQMGYVGAPEGLFDPATNIQLGVRYVTWLRAYLAAHGLIGDGYVIAAYNEGPGNAVKGLPDPDYVAAVTAARQRWAGALSGVAIS